MEDFNKKYIIYTDDDGNEHLLSFNEFISDYWHKKIFGHTFKEFFKNNKIEENPENVTEG